MLMKRSISPDLYTWKKEYELHNELYDEQTRKFLDIINRMKKIIASDTVEKDISGIFFQLTHYFEQYMLREEINMNERNYENIDRHKRAHRDFMDHIVAFREDYEKGEEDTYEKMYFFLEDWFDNHMMVEDRKAVNHISESK